MTLKKLLALGTTSFIGIALGAALPASDDPPPPPEPKKKEANVPGGELTKAYDLLRRIRSDSRPAGRPEERLKDWTERAVDLYRQAVKASGRGDEHKARELGIAAHDLARAVDHARNASAAEPDDLPPPPDAEADDRRTLRDLNQAHDRIVDLKEDDAPDSAFYFRAARDLYNAARRDVEAGRSERAGELARAAEALTHVPEHLARADREGPEPREKKAKKDRPEPPKAKGGRPEPKEPREKKEKKGRPGPDEEIPPPID